MSDKEAKLTPGFGGKIQIQSNRRLGLVEERGSSAATGLGDLAASFTSISELHEGDCCFLPLT